ncbi:MAG: L,D-transpeptidase family protein [Pseudomonadales bacterium]
MRRRGGGEEVRVQSRELRSAGFAALLAVGLALAVALWPSSARGAAYPLSDDDVGVVGAVHTIRTAYEDTLASIAERYGLGYLELVRANPGVDPWLPGEGTPLVLPTAYVLPQAERQGIVINVAEFRLYYFPPDGGRVVTYPVGLGREDFRTPLGRSRVTMVIENPSWTPTETSRREHASRGDPLPAVVQPGPDNPLGSMAMQLDIPGYYIHGTNQPFGVGQSVSQGCVRLYEPHIRTLAEIAPRGTPVQIVDEPYKLGWRHGALYLEVHTDTFARRDDAELKEKIAEEAKTRAAIVDWARVEALLAAPSGVPTRI